MNYTHSHFRVTHTLLLLHIGQDMANIVVFFVLIFKFGFCFCVPPSPTDAMLDDISVIKASMKTVTNTVERWNYVYNNQIEPRMVSSSNALAGIDNNVRNLQERAHVWDTFQLHVSAWNDQLATTDRKLDIISKGQEKLFNLDAKLNFVSNLEYKLEAIFKKMEQTEETLTTLSKKVENHRGDSLFGEFATRGILSTLKVIEKKLDKIQTTSLNAIAKQTKSAGEEAKGKLTIKCNTSPIVEELLQDVSSKVDVIFDKVSERDDERLDEEDEEYIDDQQVGSGENPKDFRTESDVKLLRKILKRLNDPCKQTNKLLETMHNKLKTIDNNTMILTKSENYGIHDSNNQTENLIHALDNAIVNMTLVLDGRESILGSFFVEQRSHFESILKAQLENKCHHLIHKNNFTSPQSLTPPHPPRNTIKYIYTDASSCDTISNTSGVYVLQATNSYNIRYCEVKPDHTWTVLQRRGSFRTLQDFSLSWSEYKRGFGKLNEEFWFGNDFMHRLTEENDLILRIELEDFEGQTAWAEYFQFEVGSEDENYRLSVGGYRGNASDSLSSHNNSLFSTYDRKNDYAPDCCPCAPSYGGGWWFNSCFEANLNGVYHREPKGNEYYRGIIWENWLGNYSLKRSTMMVRVKTDEDVENFIPVFTEKPWQGSTIYPDIEDP